jgi:hypothetical protein
MFPCQGKHLFVLKFPSKVQYESFNLLLTIYWMCLKINNLLLNPLIHLNVPYSTCHWQGGIGSTLFSDTPKIELVG